jgi:CubicO group peptidase (beta-lactamase class C family)
VPTAEVSRGDTPVRPFPVALRDDIDAIEFQPLANSGFDGPISFRQSLDANFTDAILIVQRGTIIYERYFGVTGPATRHMLMSVSKSFAGTIAAMLVADGTLDETALAGSLLPELAASGFGDATLRQIMDMTTGLAYSEDYTSATADIARLVTACGLSPGDSAGLRAYLPSIGKAGTHGEAFSYRTCNTDVLAWILHRVTGKSLTQLLSETFWQRLGMAEDACYTIDSHGSEFGGGGLNATLRDIARFGEMMRLGGSIDGTEIVPRAVVDDIRRGGDPAKFVPAGYATLPGWSYRNQWWVSHDAHGCFTARGVRGQMIWIDPVAEMTITRLGSHPLAGNGNFDPTSLPAWTAVANHLLAVG